MEYLDTVTANEQWLLDNPDWIIHPSGFPQYTPTKYLWDPSTSNYLTNAPPGYTWDDTVFDYVKTPVPKPSSRPQQASPYVPAPAPDGKYDNPLNSNQGMIS